MIYFSKANSGFSTCVFLLPLGEEFVTDQRPITVTGNATIHIDNETKNTVWMSGPIGATATEYASDVNVIGSIKITSAFVDKDAYNDPGTTLPFYGIGFNASRWYRSTFTFRNEFAKGLVQAPSSDGLYDSGNSFLQQVSVLNCKSNHAQENFMEATQCWSCTIEDNTVERGNGAFDLQRSSNQSCYRLSFQRNTIQANKMVNGQQAPFKCNFGVSFTFAGNYFESNRKQGTNEAVPSVFMAPNDVQDLNSLVFKGNFFAQSKTNLDLVGGEFAHVILDGFRSFYPRGNNFSGGNGYKMTNSTGVVMSRGETFTSFGSVYPEGNVTVSASSIDGFIELPGVYDDGDGFARVDLSKIGFGDNGFMLLQSAAIATGGSAEFRIATQSVCTLTCRLNEDASVIFSMNSLNIIPKVMSNAGSVFVFTESPTTPVAGTVNVALNASKDRLVLTSGISSSRKFSISMLCVDDVI